MKGKSFVGAAIVAILLLLSVSGQDQVIVVSGATLIDGAGRPPLAGATVVVEGERITQVGPSGAIRIPRGARVIDARTKFLLPGLIDTHVHLEMIGNADIGDLPVEWTAPPRLQDLVEINAKLNLLAGFTTVRDLGSTDVVLGLRNRINARQVIGPRIIASGRQLVKASKEARPNEMFLEYDGVDDARAKVRGLGEAGVDVMKIRLTRLRPLPSLDEVRAIVQEAHRLGRQTTVHTDVPADDLVRLAIDAGADGIEHNAPLRSRDEGVLTQMAAKKMSLMAGAGHFWLQRIDGDGLIDALGADQERMLPEDLLLALRSGLGILHEQTAQMKRSGWKPEQRRSAFIQEIQRARKAGVLMVFGTDCGAYGMIHGEQVKALYGETRMGASNMEALLMATRDAAVAVGRAGELGTIAPGKYADMLLVDANPLEDLRNLHRMYRVIRSGVVFDPAEIGLRKQR
jgi:imidazolonepropionase-like amidohydrolase